MTEQTDLEFFEQHRRKIVRKNAERLKAAKAAAHESGKEVFDLEKMYAIWPENPDARDKARGEAVSLQDRLLEWETSYYRRFSGIRTVAEFVEMMKFLQGHGNFD